MFKPKIVIATHSFSPGTSQALYAYCKSKKYSTQFIEHPLFGGLHSWFIGWLDTVYRVLKSDQKYDLFVGSNNLNASAGVVLKKLGKVKKVIYFAPDFVPVRFSNSLLNWIYHQLDFFCVKYSDISWNSSSPMKVDPIMVAREKLGLPKKYRSKQTQLPDGTDNYQALPFKQINRWQMGFVGHLRPGMGLEVLFEAMKKLKKSHPQIQLIVIGSGPIEKDLKQLILQNNLNIKMLGFMGNLKNVYRILKKCAIGLAPYQPGTISQFSDPGKIKNYLSVGLPVIVTDVVKISRELKTNKCGMVVKYDSRQLSQTIIKLMTDQKKLVTYRKNTQILAQKYSWSNIFTAALNNVF